MKYIKVVFSIVLIITLLFTFESVSAKTLSDLKRELSAAEAKYTKNQSDKKQTEADISATKEKINSITSEKVQVSKEVE